MLGKSLDRAQQVLLADLSDQTPLLHHGHQPPALQKALGATHGDIVRQMLAETGLIALAAVVCGWVLGYLLAQLLGMTVFNASIALRLPVLPITLVLSLLVAAAAAIVPVRRAVSVEPAKVLKGE